MEKIIANNKLIAEFMGGTLITPKNNLYQPYYRWYHTDTEMVKRDVIISRLRYHGSWDWMMAVIEEINSFQAWKVGAGVCLHQRSCSIGYHANANVLHVYEKSFDITKNDQTKTLLENTFDAIVEFINWYNKNK